MGKVIPLRARAEAVGLMHVWSTNAGYEVVHESASGGSYGVFEQFDERDDAVAYALRMLPRFEPCRLGEIAL